MRYDWLGHHHSRLDSPVHRWPASAKLTSALGIILITVVAPFSWWCWPLGVAIGLVVIAALGRIPFGFLGKRLVLLSPFVLGVALANHLNHSAAIPWQPVVVRSGICLLTILVLSNTTPFSELLRVLQRLRVPAVMITTLALMYRYLFVLVEEAERMRRARASRTFTRGRRRQWSVLATVAGQLFVRASERAERIYAAMCARGWK
jgi:cobalt/nickel transport system permease protein